MHETRTTLATKQPAFTASALVNSFGATNNSRADLHKVAITIARTIRSQLASFAGNLLMVFPLTFLLAGLYHSVTGQFVVGGKDAHELLVSQHPFRSFSLLYACFTGFFLFLSGLIAGYVENHINYGKIAQRLKFHPVFKNTLKPQRLERLTTYVEKNFGALSGNLALGFFLGMAGFFGKIFGVPFDIRHITISAGNTGIAFFAVGRDESTGFLLTVFFGVLLIGLLNFLVSFSLAFLVAARSRGVRLRDYPDLFFILGRFFKKYPADFIRPPKNLRNPDDLRRVAK
jgi:site-specific recombinase